MKPQDIIVALKLLSHDSSRTVRDLATCLYLSKSEISNCQSRLIKSYLLNNDRQVMKANLFEFILFGLKYVFPGELGAPARGIPTAWGHKLFNQIRAKQIPVWPDADGQTYGPAIKPLYPKLPKVCRVDPYIYECAASIDAIRVGRTREKVIAQDYFTSLLKG